MLVCNDTMTTSASVVALGMFDGVHTGHRELLRRARAVARENGVPLVVQTFAAHPLCLLSPENCPPLLTTARERENLIEQQGVDLYYAPPFTPEVRDQSPEVFVRELTERWHPVAVVVGFNYTLGAKGEGTPKTLKARGKKQGLSTVVLPAERFGSNRLISATLIRGELAVGRVMLAHLLLGRLYARQVKLVRREGERCLLTWRRTASRPWLRGYTARC
jgi:riboflavin kinase/FMN adenylyltransferase